MYEALHRTRTINFSTSPLDLSSHLKENPSTELIQRQWDRKKKFHNFVSIKRNKGRLAHNNSDCYARSKTSIFLLLSTKIRSRHLNNLLPEDFRTNTIHSRPRKTEQIYSCRHRRGRLDGVTINLQRDDSTIFESFLNNDFHQFF